MLRPIYTLFVGALVLTMCKKESISVSPAPPDPPPDTELTSGLPERPDSIHGYFFSAYNYYRDFNNVTYTTMSCYAQFCDPPSNLIASIDKNYRPYYSPITARSNVQMGNLGFNYFYMNDVTTETSTAFYYVLNSYDKPACDQRVFWSVSGNEIIPAFEQKIKDEFPLPKLLGSNFSMDCKKDYTVRPADHFDRWDSIIVHVTGDIGSGNYTMIKRSGADSILTISQNELDFYRSSSKGRLTVRAFRFFYRKIGGRRYVFELGTSAEYTLNMIR